MPLLERVRVEVYLPDLPSSEYQNLFRSFEEEFTYAFGGSSIISGLDVRSFIALLVAFPLTLIGSQSQSRSSVDSVGSSAPCSQSSRNRETIMRQAERCDLRFAE